MTLPTIYVAIAALDDEELVPTLKDLYSKASQPSRVHVGLAVQSTSSKWYRDISKEAKSISPNIRHLFVKITSKNALEVLGVGQGRELSHSMYEDEDYVLQIDSHSMFMQDWDEILIAMLYSAKKATDNERTLLTAYAGNYFLDKEGNRTLEFPEGLTPHSGFYYPLYRQYVNNDGLPSWDTVPLSRVSDSPARFIPSPKFNANFAFGDKEFAANLGLDASVVFFEEEIIQTVSLMGSGWSLVFPNVKDAVVRHLYVAEGEMSAVRRKAAASYLSEVDRLELTQRMQRNYRDFLDFEVLKGAKTDYENYANVSLKYGRRTPETIYPSTWTLQSSTAGCKDPEVHDHVDEPAPEPQEPKKARPWDMLDPRIGRVDDKVKQLRMDFCYNCEFFISLTQQCKKCGCHMPWKTSLPHAECPVGKWSAVPDESSVE